MPTSRSGATPSRPPARPPTKPGPHPPRLPCAGVFFGGALRQSAPLDARHRPKQAQSVCRILASQGWALGETSPHWLPWSSSWKLGRVVDCTGLENRQPARVPGFESLSFRQPLPVRRTARAQATQPRPSGLFCACWAQAAPARLGRPPSPPVSGTAEPGCAAPADGAGHAGHGWHGSPHATPRSAPAGAGHAWLPNPPRPMRLPETPPCHAPQTG